MDVMKEREKREREEGWIEKKEGRCGNLKMNVRIAEKKTFIVFFGFFTWVSGVTAIAQELVVMHEAPLFPFLQPVVPSLFVICHATGTKKQNAAKAQ